MKKTVKINIGSVFFHVDEDAFVILNAYIEKIKIRFKTDREGSEIIDDIENRIAELLQLKLNEQKQVITIDDVNEMIEIMGRPEDFEEEETEENTTFTETTGNKRFYRDLDNNVAGGVCAGLGAYFNIDPVILRVLFIVLTFPLAGFPVVLYLVLWILLPAAITTAQKMEMRSGNFTISDIENRVKNEFENVKSNFKHYKNSRHYRNSRNTVHYAGRNLVEIIHFIGRIILILVGVALILSGISLIASMFGVFVFSDSFLFWTHTGQHHVLIPDFLYSMINPQSVMLATICVLIVVAVPIIAIIYWGLKLILRFKSNDKVIAMVGTVAWILSIIILVGITMLEAKDYAFSSRIGDPVDINLPNGKTLYIKSSANINEFSEVQLFDEGMNVYTLKEFPDRIYLEPKLDIRFTSRDDISVKFEKEARGATNSRARQNASNIQYNWHLQDSVLYIDPLFYHNNNDRWDFPEIDITLYLPKNQKIYVDEDLKQTLNDIETRGNIWHSGIAGHYWTMTYQGLDYP